jgi:hypothetical protein
VFRLEPGTHQLIVRGQEPNVRLDRFSVVLVLPEVVTLEATNGPGSSVFVTGTVNPLGTETHAYFEYGLSPDYGATTTLTNVGSGGEPVALRMRLSGLWPGALHHYRLVAFNGNGTNFGADRVFVSGAPKLRSAMMQDGQFSVTVTTVSNWVYFLQRRQTLLDAPWQTVTKQLGDGSVQTLTDPQPPDGRCYYRVEAGPLPAVQAASATLLWNDFVLLSGVVQPYGLPASAFFEYGATTNFGERTASWELAANQGATGISNLISGLESESVYHFRLVASNANGLSVSPAGVFVTAGPKISSSEIQNGVFSASIPTRPNRWYAVEFATNLVAPVWVSITGFVGDGSLHTLLDPVREETSRFYRIRVEVPLN